VVGLEEPVTSVGAAASIGNDRPSSGASYITPRVRRAVLVVVDADSDGWRWRCFLLLLLSAAHAEY